MREPSPPFLALKFLRVSQCQLIHTTTSPLPRVFLHATDQSALSNGASLDLLKKFAAEPEVLGGGASLEKNVAVTPSDGKGGFVKETH